MLSWYPQAITSIRPPTNKHLPYLIYVKDTNLDAHIWVFKKAIKVNGKTFNRDIINLINFILQNSIFERGIFFIGSSQVYFCIIRTSFL